VTEIVEKTHERSLPRTGPGEERNQKNRKGKKNEMNGAISALRKRGDKRRFGLRGAIPRLPGENLEKSEKENR